MKRILYIVGLTFLSGIVAHAELFVDASRTAGKSNWEVGVHAGLSETEYKYSGRGGPIADGAKQDAERTTVSAYGALGLTDWLDIFVSGGYIVQSDGIWHTKASGLVVAGGVRAEAWRRDRFAIMVYLQASHRAEDYDDEDWYYYERVGTRRYPWGTVTEHSETYSKSPPDDGGPYERRSVGASSTSSDVALGAIGRYRSGRVACYGGLELVPWSDGEIEEDMFDGSKSDMERSGALGVKAGASYELAAGMFLHGEATLLNEQTIRLGLSKVF